MPFLGPLDPFELARHLRRGFSAATQRLRPDHLAIRHRAVQWFPGTSMSHFFLYVVVAPSRSALRSFDDGQVGRARAVVEDAFPGVFPDNPAWADERFVLFAVEGADGGREYQLYVHRPGLSS